MELNDAKTNAKLLVKDWLENIFVDKQIIESENLIEKGLSSIQVMQLSGKLKKAGIRISFAKLMENPSMSKWFEFIEESKVKISKNTENLISKNDNKQFDLTDVQYSYLIGREDDQILGGVGCHAYLEIDGENIDEYKLKEAWNKLQYRHPMLRVKFTKDGHQEILDKPYSEEIEVIDLADFDEETLHLKLVEIREQKSHRKLNVNQGQVAGVALAKFLDGKSRIFFDVDLLVSDVMSMSIMIKELAELYTGVELDNFNEYTFKDYMQNGISELINDADKEFWEQKINSFEIERPNLPLRKQPEQIKETKFTRRKRIIKKDEWEAIKDIAASYQSTPSMVLLTAYTLVLERWCNQDKFFINIPLFNRDLENEYLKDMVADFTNILLVEHETVDDSRFLDTLKRINKTFLENVSHSAYSGVQVQRDISKNQGTSVNIAPVVFACNIDYPLETEISRKNLGKVSYMISQTPGVWLDFQTYIMNGNLILCWDSVDELFPTGMLDDMMDSLYELIISLTQKQEWEKKVDVLPEKQKSIRKHDVEEILPLQYPNETLYNGFLRNVKLNPDKVAIIDSETKEQITYYKLYEISLKVADCLNKNGVKKGDYVGVTLPRGSRQLYAIFGILFTGAAYVSIGITQPNDRRTKIYDQIGIKYIISDEKTIKDCCLNKSEVKIIDLNEAMANESKLEQPIEISPYDSAYIIMTSGTTGVPKGVEIMHTSAVNTCIDLNKKYNVNAEDTILMVSAIDFDLSVYDIFGMLHAGGTVITTSEENYRNPDEWLNLVDEYKVTIWDSVPILFDMIVTMAEGKNRKLPFRIVMLSGDWIAINLPERFYNISSKSINSIVVAMGGATEASIWSNYLDVPREIPKDWISIPYGKPLKNQVYRVVDEFDRICPNYVKGELLIGGVGVAKCYHGDEELTNKKYFEQDGIRWYRTGDNGRIWNNGTIEFLGRKDTQVKVKGHRIELGEIEDAIRRHESVDSAIVDFIEKETGKQLVAFVKMNKKHHKNNDNVGQKEMDKSIIVIPESKSENKTLVQNKEINKVVIKTVLEVLNNIGIDFGRKTFSIDELYKNLKDSEESIFIAKHWIDTLLSYGVLRSIGNKYEFISNNFGVEIKDESMRKICEYTTNLTAELTDVLTGNKEAIEVFYADDNKFSINELCENLIGYDESLESIFKSLKNLVTINQGKKLKILEFATRNKKITEWLFNELKDHVEEYTYADNSIYYKDNLSVLQECESFKYVVEKEICDKFGNDYFDVIIALNSIHRASNSQDRVNGFINALKADGVLIGNEINKCNLLPIITADIIESKDFLDEKEISFVADNSEIMYESNSHNTFLTNFNTFAVRKLRNSKITFNEIEHYLREEIPAYMIPTYFYEVDNIPLNKNGKVDRKILKSRIETRKANDINSEKNKEEPKTKIEEVLLDIWKNVLNRELSVRDNYFLSGGDSLTATVIIGKIKKQMHIEISIKDIFQNPSVNSLATFISAHYEKILIDEEDNKIKITLDKKCMHEPFPLTDVQMAYWIGRQGAYKLGNVSTHCYFEFDCIDLDIARLQKILNEIVKYHPALRTIVLDTAEQQILAQYPHFLMEINDISLLNKESIKDILQQIRENLSHRVIDLSTFPNFDFKVVKISKNTHRIFVGLDNTILDGWSMFEFLRELKSRYDNKYIEENMDISFRDYVLYKKEFDRYKYEKDRDYWLSRLNSFPHTPELSIMTKNNNNRVNQKFSRKEAVIEKDKWLKIKNISTKNNITPTSVLISLFSTVISKYSGKDNLVINVTQFIKDDIHPQIYKIMGDFTDLNLLEVNLDKKSSIVDNSKKIQTQLISDLEHSSYSTIDFLRELRKCKDDTEVGTIVFTSGLGMKSNTSESFLGELNYSISQTPQIWLDHQVMEFDGNLILIWDYVSNLFASDAIDICFADYLKIIDMFIENYENKIFELIELTNNNSIDLDKGNLDKICNIEKIEERQLNDKYISNKELTKVDTLLENKVVEIIKTVLNLDKLELGDDFFKVGGNSLNAVQLTNLVNKNFDINLSIVSILENSLIKDFSSVINNEMESRKMIDKNDGNEVGFV